MSRYHTVPSAYPATSSAAWDCSLIRGENTAFGVVTFFTACIALTPRAVSQPQSFTHPRPASWATSCSPRACGVPVPDPRNSPRGVCQGLRNCFGGPAPVALQVARVRVISLATQVQGTFCCFLGFHLLDALSGPSLT